MYVQAAREFDVERKEHSIQNLRADISSKEETIYELRYARDSAICLFLLLSLLLPLIASCFSLSPCL